MSFEPTSQASSNQPLPPECLGILSRTVSHSPDYKFIIPVRIRDRKKNDVVLVGENAIHVKEILTSGRLAHIATKSDFSSGIRAACAIGDRIISGDLSSDEEHGGDKKRFSSESVRPASDDLAWWLQPAQYLVLTLNTPEMMVITLRQYCSGRIYFETKTIPLIRTDLRPFTLPGRHTPGMETPGRHIAVDPHSQALAIGACSRNIWIGELKPVDQADGPDKVVTKTKLISVGQDVTITKMEFLYPPEQDKNTLYLLLVVYRQGKMVFRTYVWPKGGDLPSRHIQQSQPPQVKDHDVPTVLAPLCKTPGAFLLICNRLWALYHGAHQANITQIRLGASSPGSCKGSNVFIDIACHSPGFSVRAPLWSSWTRPPRGRHAESENLYVCREDGVLCYVLVDHDDANDPTVRRYHIKDLGCNVNQAIAYLDLGKGMGSEDAIIFGGEMSDGAVYSVGTGQPNSATDERSEGFQMTNRTFLHNWAPFTDAETVPRALNPINGSAQLFLGSRETRVDEVGDNIFSTSGKEPCGAVSQIRYGCEVQIERSAYLDAIRMWLFKIAPYDTPIFMTTMPDMTTLAPIPPRGTEEVNSVSAGEEQTLAAEVLALESFKVPKNVLVQVTGTSISLYKIRLNEDLELIPGPSFDTPPNLLNVAIEPLDRLILLATESTLSLRRIHLNGQEVLGPVVEADDVPTCMAFYSQREDLKKEEDGEDDEPQRSGEIFAAVGFHRGSVKIYQVDFNRGMIPLFDYKLQTESTDTFAAVCESIALLPPAPSDSLSLAYMVCGLRSGHVHTVGLLLGQDGELSQLESANVHVGSGPVQVLSDANSSAAAFLCCSGNALYLHLRGPDFPDPTIKSIWFTDPEQRSFAPSRIDFLARAALRRSDSNEFTELLAKTPDGWLFGEIDVSSSAVPRRIQIPGTTNRIIFSSHFRSLFVSSSRMKIVNGRRFSWPSVSTIGVDHQDAVPSPLIDIASDDVVEEHHHLYPGTGSKINCLTEWHWTERQNRFSFLIVGTSESRASGPPTGSLKIFKLRRAAHGAIQAMPWKSYEQKHPVLAVCPYQGNSFLYCVGEDIWKQIYNISQGQGRLQKVPMRSLSSPCNYITANNSFVYVTTAENSLTVFVETNSGLEPYASDRMARTGLSHLAIPEHDLVLFSDKTKSVAGFRVPRQRTIQNVAPECFEASLPMSMTRLCHANCRPPWKQGLVSGVLERDVIGTAADGSFYSFSILTEPLWRLLAFIQNMLRRDPRCSTQRTRNCTTLEPSTERARNFHIDGDFLQKILDHSDPIELLKSILGTVESGNGNVNGRSMNHETPEWRRKRLVELFNDVRQNPAHGKPLGVSDADVERRVVHFLEKVLDIPF